MPTPEKHALLSASSAERWLNCTPSARLAEDMPDKSTQYTEAGRLAHAIAELKLRKQYLEAMGPRKFTTADVYKRQTWTSVAGFAKRL